MHFTKKNLHNFVGESAFMLTLLKFPFGVPFLGDACLFAFNINAYTLTYMLQYWGRLVHQDKTVNQNIRLSKYGLATKCKTYINRCMALRKQHRIYPLHSA